MLCICGNEMSDETYCRKCGMGKHSDYKPNPINIREIKLPDNYNDLIEKIAVNIHDEWAAIKIKEGWSYGEMRYDRRMRQSLENMMNDVENGLCDERGSQEWTYGIFENERRKKHPCLLPFNLLPDDEKRYNRFLAENILKVISFYGYMIVKD